MGMFVLYGLQSSALNRASLIQLLRAPSAHHSVPVDLAYAPVRFDPELNYFEAATAVGWLPLEDEHRLLSEGASISVAGRFSEHGALAVDRVLHHPHRKYKVYVAELGVVFLLFYTLIHWRQVRRSPSYLP